MENATMSIKRIKGVDWAGQKHVEIQEEVPKDTTVGEVVTEMIHAMGLPSSTAYSAYYQGRKLSRSETVIDAGLEDEAEITVSPEVTAGM